MNPLTAWPLPVPDMISCVPARSVGGPGALPRQTAPAEPTSNRNAANTNPTTMATHRPRRNIEAAPYTPHNPSAQESSRSRSQHRRSRVPHAPSCLHQGRETRCSQVRRSPKHIHEPDVGNPPPQRHASPVAALGGGAGWAPLELLSPAILCARRGETGTEACLVYVVDQNGGHGDRRRPGPKERRNSGNLTDYWSRSCSCWPRWR